MMKELLSSSTGGSAKPSYFLIGAGIATLIGFVILVSVILSLPSEFKLFAAIESIMDDLGYGRSIVADKVELDPESEEGKLVTRITGAAVAARETNGIRIHTGLIGSTYTYINQYDPNFEYSHMTEDVINDLIYNMVTFTGTLQCVRIVCVQNEIDVECNPVTSTITYKEGESASCPEGSNQASDTRVYTLNLDKYYDYLSSTFISANTEGIEAEEIEEIIELLKTAEERYLDYAGVTEMFRGIDVGYVPPEVAEEFSSPIATKYIVTSWFGWRLNPTDFGVEFHSGIDLGGYLEGKPVVAPAAGVVSKVGRDSSCGNKVILRHNIKGKQYETIYCHLSTISVYISDPSNPPTVAKGDMIGRVGSTGRSTGPHLHWGVWEGRYWVGTRIDPLVFIKNDPNCTYGKDRTPCSLKR